MLEEMYTQQLGLTLKNYLQECCKNERLDESEARLSIRLHEGRIRVFLYNGRKHIREVPLADIVRLFIQTPEEDGGS